MTRELDPGCKRGREVLPENHKAVSDFIAIKRSCTPEYFTYYLSTLDVIPQNEAVAGIHPVWGLVTEE